MSDLSKTIAAWRENGTPGPWAVGNIHVDNGVYTADGDLVAETHSAQRNFDRDAQIREQDANAALIAAAPAMTDRIAELEAENERLRKARNLAIAHIYRLSSVGDQFGAFMHPVEADAKPLHRAAWQKWRDAVHTALKETGE